MRLYSARVTAAADARAVIMTHAASRLAVFIDKRMVECGDGHETRRIALGPPIRASAFNAHVIRTGRTRKIQSEFGRNEHAATRDAGCVGRQACHRHSVKAGNAVRPTRAKS